MIFSLCVIAGPVEINRVYFFKKHQADYIIKAVHQGMSWYTSPLAKDDMVEESSCHSQGKEVMIKLPKTNNRVDDREDSQFNRDYHLENHKHVHQVRKYLQKHGLWELKEVPRDGSCCFGAARVGLKFPPDYTDDNMRCEVAVFSALNAEILRNHHKMQLLHDGPRHDQNEPLTIQNYLLNILDSTTWGDGVILDMISRSWG